MKRFFAIIITILLIAATIFCLHSCLKDKSETNAPEENKDSSGLELYVPKDDPNTEEDESAPTKHEIVTEDESPVYTGVGIYHGKVDSNFIEVTLEGIQPTLISARISPELAKNFSSLKLQEGSIISFEYQIINDMHVIQKILKWYYL